MYLRHLQLMFGIWISFCSVLDVAQVIGHDHMVLKYGCVEFLHSGVKCARNNSTHRVKSSGSWHMVRLS